jgi:hypothetical protein
MKNLIIIPKAINKTIVTIKVGKHTIDNQPMNGWHNLEPVSNLNTHSFNCIHNYFSVPIHNGLATFNYYFSEKISFDKESIGYKKILLKAKKQALKYEQKTTYSIY